jgi:hypothetical protein
MSARYAGTHRGLRAEVLAALRASETLASRVSSDPPEVMGAAPDGGQLGRVYVGILSGRHPAIQRGYREGDGVLSSAVVSISSWVRRQPSDRTRTSDATTHSYDEALDLQTAIVRALIAAVPFREISHNILVAEGWHQVQVQLTVDWDLTVT